MTDVKDHPVYNIPNASDHHWGTTLHADQGERLMYPSSKDKEGNDTTREGPLNISPTPITDSKAVGYER
jgi:hypothetical protein